MASENVYRRRMIAEKAESMYREIDKLRSRLGRNQSTPLWLCMALENINHLAFIVRAQAVIDRNNALEYPPNPNEVK